MTKYGKNYQQLNENSVPILSKFLPPKTMRIIRDEMQRLDIQRSLVFSQYLSEIVTKHGKNANELILKHIREAS